MITTRRRAGLAGTLILVALAISSPMPARATPPGDPGLIAIGCEAGLWTIEPTGEGLVQITDQPVEMPDWSAGGTMIAFIRFDEPDRSSLWVMSADGSAPLRLTQTDAVLLDPSWTPDGEFVAFSSDQAMAGNNGHRHVRRIRPVRDAFSQAIAAEAQSDLDDPTWSPNNVWDGELLVTLVRETWPQSVWRQDMSSFTLNPVTAPPSDSTDGQADWHPAGDRFAFVRDDGIVRSIQVMDSDGTDPVALTDETLDAISPTYSADGTSIAFLARSTDDAGTGAPYDLWTMNGDGQNQQPIAQDVPCDHIDWQPVPDFPLVDARFSEYESAIRWAYQTGITTGCTSERFCPWDQVTRGQMATFLAEAFGLPPAMNDHFGDDDGTTHEDDINRLVEAGIAKGCTSSRFCPHNRLTRAEMASLLARALDLPAATADYFDDDDGQTHEANINRLAEAGLTNGCGDRRFCPSRFISRGEAVALLYRALAP